MIVRIYSGALWGTSAVDVWCKENGLDAGWLLPEVFVDLSARKIYAWQVATDALPNEFESFPPSVLLRGIPGLWSFASPDSRVCVQRVAPLLVDPPQEIIAGGHTTAEPVAHVAITAADPTAIADAIDKRRRDALASVGLGGL